MNRYTQIFLLIQTLFIRLKRAEIPMDETGRGEKINHLEIRYKKNEIGSEVTCLYACVRVRVRLCFVYAD